jgi:hypothetical protein
MQQNLVQIHLVVYIHILFYLLLYTFMLLLSLLFNVDYYRCCQSAMPFDSTAVAAA